ncbi:MAG TPA: TipAS antibiotic-recognition domain-containing protein [Clostridia bacterium]|nr:TipAS antibiotic-recognition domain-containing protein [Clostridia bacterium]
MEKFRGAMLDGPNSLAAREAVNAYGDLINMWIPCDDKTFSKIGQSYLKYKEDLDKETPGIAEFVYNAILHVYE